ncbi:HNHc domain containing protein [uncultured Caudovirales phage]|uniref:HNHc domain containing protein n=1 Tax=uncultured Caudovirales phage TaxID=2100421 RepID=A0A6J5P7H2_9CAUD|nr:HNHc domain containing protein [uncultured Caudovirales phage]CAB4175095.1 HNHc domain containing protein [uncultured Caudovirales phage]CAB4179131.1 HNHc domain containing protein [uncultured Caudovirales phage]CAB4189081.1 HNHc domain containing protein [uncultured Caudovirales phage]CAB4193109.1 HNHc domain containing protein [uncultured Caudovirales phage]
MVSAMPFKDKVKQRESARKHYARNSGAIQKRTAENNRLLRRRNKAFIDDVKGTNPCTDCGVSYPPYVMQFDHIVDGKRGNVADMARSGFSLENLQLEIDKCELVCGNCHAERTHGFKEELEEDFPNEA